MSQEPTTRIAQQLLAGIGAGVDPDETSRCSVLMCNLKSRATLARCCGSDGRPGAAPRPTSFATRAVLSSASASTSWTSWRATTGAVILGELASRVSAIGKIIESAFALTLTVSDGEITRFHMLEDSFAVSRAARSWIGRHAARESRR
jgi:hypothetical protein